MTHKAKVLVVEDTSEWQEAFGEVLDEAGYSVEIANSYTQAKQILDRHAFDVAVVDIRLSESDNRNTDGMRVLERIAEVKDTTRAMIVSGYGTVGLTRDAFKKYEVIDFVEKKRFKADQFLQLVETGAQEAKQARNNQFEKVFRETGLSLKQDSRLPGPAQDRDNLLKAMLMDLLPLSQAVPDSPYVPTTLKLVTTPEGEPVAQILGWSRGLGKSFVVRLGTLSFIQQESRNYTKFIKGLAVDGRSTMRVGDPFYKSNLGGLVYALEDAHLEFLCNFITFYTNAAYPQAVKAVEDILTVCSNLHNSRGIDKVTADLSSVYQDVIERAAAARKRDEEEEDYYLEQMDPADRQSYLQERQALDPIAFAREQAFTFTTQVGVTHGDLRGGNILVDPQARTWLVGFSQTGDSDVVLTEADTSESVAFRAKQGGKRSLLHDFATLEASIRETLLGVDPQALTAFDVALSRPTTFSESISFAVPASAPELEKAFKVIARIRELANEALGSGGDMQPYYAELLYQFLATYARLPSGEERERAFASAAVLAARLDNWQ